MEVFMRNLPLDLTDHGLQNHLTPMVKGLHIKDWSCQKVRKKPFRSVTFLLLEDGQRFLQRYGQEVIPSGMFCKSQDKTLMMILGKPVYCTLSKKPPDPFLLKCLVKSAQDRRKTKEPLLPSENAKVLFGAKSLLCGLDEYVDNELSYSPQIEWLFVTGTAKFVKKALVVDYEDKHGRKRVEIPFCI
ncbi:hypothetical protein DM02DRAFT_677234 [Periconia macrospinosa]|uniref:Uncharacterized protein n=1 Tax=Periconia macrospinosa TaxID=97972 RepID=A0A2V1D498_9PLEO|nr:hypothetical protein DM02DRAFT_677234 [Periconia macrospinosa]